MGTFCAASGSGAAGTGIVTPVHAPQNSSRSACVLTAWAGADRQVFCKTSRTIHTEVSRPDEPHSRQVSFMACAQPCMCQYPSHLACCMWCQLSWHELNRR